VFLSIYRGRRITSNGQRDLDQVAGRITVAAV
jgi:ribosomal protein S19E (S16A)